MGWVESRLKSNCQLIQAVKDLRLRLGDTQEDFANRLGLSKRTIASYEKSGRPSATVLARLAKTASDVGMGNQAIRFMTELGRDLQFGEIKTGVLSVSLSDHRGFVLIPIDDSESHRYAKAFFDAMSKFHAGDPTEKAKARESLARFAKEVTKA